VLGVGPPQRDSQSPELARAGLDPQHVTTAYFLKPANDPSFLSRLQTELRVSPGLQLTALIDPAPFTSNRTGSTPGGNLTSAIATRHQLFITHPIPGVTSHQPITRVIDCNVYVRPADGGLMLVGGYESSPMPFDMAALPARFGMEDLPLDLSVLRRLADQISDQFPIVREVTVKERRAACRR